MYKFSTKKKFRYKQCQNNNKKISQNRGCNHSLDNRAMCLSVKDNKVGGGPNYIGGAFELSLAGDSLPKTVTRYDGGMTAVPFVLCAV